MDLNNPKNETELAAAMATFGQVTVSNDIKFSTSMSSKKKNTLTIESGASLAPAADFRSSVSELIFVGGGELTLDGEGTVVGPSNSTYGNGSQAILLQGGTVNIKGNLTVEGGSGSVGNHAVTITDGTANIYGGYFHAGLDKDGQSSELIYLRPAYRKNAKCNIYGGVFEIEGDAGFLINMKDSERARCTIAIYGGTFIGFNPADNSAEGAHTNFVADGYMAVETTYNGKQSWEVKAIPVVGTQERFAEEIVKPNTSVILSAGTYTMPSAVADGVSIIGSDASTSILTLNAAAAWHDVNATLKNVTIKSPNDNYIGIQHASSIKYEGCVIEGQPFSYANNAVFEKCTFNQTSSAAYNIWTYGSKEITFNNCVFNCAGKGVLVYKEVGTVWFKATFNDCKFIASAPVAGKAAIEIDSSLNPYEVYINNCTSEGFDNGSKSGNSLWNNKKGDSTNLKVVVDGVPQTLN